MYSHLCSINNSRYMFYVSLEKSLVPIFVEGIYKHAYLIIYIYHKVSTITGIP